MLIVGINVCYVPLADIRREQSICSQGAPVSPPRWRSRSGRWQATLGIGGEVWPDAIEEIHLDWLHVLDLDPATRLGLEQGGDLVERAPGDVDAARLASFLQALRDIGRVAPDVVGEAPRADDTGY